ncbi:MAG: DUF7151 family protein [Saccharospirillum sp.]
MPTRFTAIVSACFVCFSLTACISDSGESGNSVTGSDLPPGTLMRTSTITDVAVCPAGGVLIEVGTDDNRNDALDDGEVAQSQQLCNGASGADGQTSQISVTPVVPAPDTCEYGGVAINVELVPGDGTVDTTLLCRDTPDCSWTDNGDGTITVSCNGEPPYLLLATTSLEFTESIRCDVNIAKAGTDPVEPIPMSYTIDKIGTHLKHVSLTVYDGESQFTNSRLLSSGQIIQSINGPVDIYEDALVNVFYDNFSASNGGRFYAYLQEPANTVYFVYQDEDLVSDPDNPNGLVGGGFTAFDADPANAACRKVLPQ